MREPSADRAEVEQEFWEPDRVVLGLYEVGDELGRGGMGVVHRVRHRNWNHWMAVKSPLPRALSGPGGKEDFVREAELWVNLPAHPNIVTCHYVRTIAGIPRIFAEYVDGGSLKDRIAGGQLRSLESILDIAIQMAWGLALAHGEGLVHQDMKPGNVMLTSGGAAKITDFGLAKARARAAGGDAAGDAAGDVAVSARGLTREYASPEQMAGERLSRKTDIWSWAVTVLDMFTGGVSCELGPAAGWTLEEHLKRGPQESLPAMPEGLAGLLRCCFAIEPDERPGDFDEIAEELRDIYREATDEPHARQAPQRVDFLADGLNNRALSMLDLGKTEEAERSWEAAVESNPTHPESTYNLGLIRWRSGRVDDLGLVRQLEEVCRVHQGEWLPPYLLALVHLERDDCENAIATLDAMPEEQANREEVASALKEARERSPGRRFLRTFEGHEDPVWSVWLGTDGRYALSGSWDATLKLWEVATGRCLRTFEGHQRFVNSVCLSTDGRYALSGSEDRTLKLWEVATGRCLRTFDGPIGQIACVAFSHDCRVCVSGSQDGVVRLWNVTTGECVRTFEGHEDSVTSVCLSTDVRYALSSSADRTLKLWDAPTGKCLRTLEGHKEGVNSVCLSADLRYALSGSHDSTLKLWDVATGDCIRSFRGHRDGVYSVCLSADGQYGLSGSSDKTLKLWDVATGGCLRTFEGHTEGVESVCLSADGRHALSGSGDETLKLWQAAPEGDAFVAPTHLSMVVGGEAASELENRFRALLTQAGDSRKRGDFAEVARLVRKARSLTGYEHSDEALAAWSALYPSLPRTGLRAGWHVRTFEGHKSTVASVCLSADGSHALSGSHDKTLKLWVVATGRCVRTFEGHKSTVASVCLSADGSHALSGSDDKTLKLWEVATGRCLRTFEGHTSDVGSVHLSADGRHVLSGGADKTLRLWDVATGECLSSFKAGVLHTVHSVCLSADGRYALSNGENNAVNLWEVAMGRLLRTFEGHKEAVSSVSLSADGCYALSGSYDATLKVWDVSTCECLRTFEGHQGFDAWVHSVCMSRDGRYALSGSNDKTLKLWDMATGKCVRTFEGHTSGVKAVCLSADGRYALSGSGDDTLKLWFLDWELEDKEPADWDEAARPYLETFLTLHTPYLAELPQDREPTGDEITLALTRGGHPRWTEDDFRYLLYTLGCAGYGWLRPEGVRGKLEELVRSAR